MTNAPSRNPVPGRRGLPLTVYIADDSAPIADMLTEILTAPGRVEVIGVGDSEDSAIEAITRLRPDAVVLDMQLKTGSGANVIRALRANAHLGATRVIVVLEPYVAAAQGGLPRARGGRLLRQGEGAWPLLARASASSPDAQGERGMHSGDALAARCRPARRPRSPCICAQRDHAGRRLDLAGDDVERTVVEIALDDLAVDLALGERARAVRAGIVGHEEAAAEVEDREDEALALDLERAAFRDLAGRAQSAKSIVADLQVHGTSGSVGD